MEEWALAVTVLGGFAALATLVQRVISQLMGRIEIMENNMRADMDRRMTLIEQRRLEDATLLQERLMSRDDAISRVGTELHTAAAEHARIDRDIAGLRREFSEHRQAAAAAYVTRETYLEAEGRTFIKLEKILDRINSLDRPHG